MIKNQRLIFTYIFLIFSILASATEYTVSSVDDFNELNLLAGDVVIWQDGTYSSDERIKFLGTGTANNPITLKAETPGGVIFTGGLQMNIGGEYLIVDGFYWNGGYGASNFIQFRDGETYSQNSTIQNCVINGVGVSPDDLEPGTSVKHRWVVLYGNYNTVTNCSFLNKSNAGATVLVELEFNAEADRCTEVGHTISNNYFYKYNKIDPSLTNSGDSESIRIGTSEFQNVNCATTVSNNYFVEADGENEIITNKSRNNIYINNTFRRCRGSLVLRHGAGAVVQGNIFLGENVDGTGGIRVVDSDHVITNNYIQDCINIADLQAIWNNGITFMGGGDSSVTNCNSTSVSNGYQRSQNIVLSNNTIVNTNAPFFYNGDKGTNDITGTVEDNIIYYDNGSRNITDLISGDESDSFSSFGASLDYSGNVYNNTNLGATANGFTSSNLSSSANGEILNISGAAGKGANLNGYEPTTDNMVGNGIGACFLGAEGNGQTDCDGGTISPVNSLTVTSLNEFDADGNSQTITVTSNINWVVSENSSWISVNRTSGSNNGSVTVTTSENTSTNDRSATITITGSGISRTISVTQEGAEDTDTPITDYTSIPSLIEAEDFDTQSGIRTEDTLDNGGGENVGFIDTDDFLTYNINVPNSGDYIIDFRVASRVNDIDFDIYSGNSIIGAISTNTTGNWQTWKTVSETVTLNQGDQTIRLVATGSGWNINWLEFTEDENTGGPIDPSESCTEGTNLSLNSSIVDFSDEQNSTNTVQNIIDNNTENRWSAENYPQFATIDLGANLNVNEIDLATFQDRDYQFIVEGSTTSATTGFTTLVDARNNTNDGPINLTFNTQTVRYVKLTVTGANTYTGPWISISRFEIICAGGSVPEVDPNGGTITGGPYTFTVGDGVADNVSNVELSGNQGENSQWVITDDANNILGLPPTPEAVDFDGAGEGTCLIWHLSYKDGLNGLEAGNNLSDFEGEFDLSNSISVFREVESSTVNGGTITGGPYTFTVGDGVADNVSGVELSGNQGENSQWVITDDANNILGLPPTPEAVNFDGAGEGTCLIWHLSYEDGLNGLEAGNNLSDFEGEFDLSNFISVFREVDDTTITPESCNGGSNLSLNSTIVDFSTEENSTNTVQNIIDNNTGNRWSAETYPQFVTIDLGANFSVDEINLATFQDRDYQFIVEGSTASATAGFSTLVDARNNTSDGPIGLSFDAQTVRYVKLTVTGANSYTGPWISISRFRIVCAGGNTSIPTDLDPNLPPSENFDLTNWNINVPIEDPEDGDSTNIERTELNDGYELKNVNGRDYFYTGADGGMVFINYPKDAPKTSPRTAYSRTELREILTDNTSARAPENNWYLSTSDNDIPEDAGGVDGVLTATVAVNHVTIDGNSNHRGRVVIAQIHGSSNEPNRLYYHKLPEHDRGAIYVAHEDIDGDQNYYNIIGNYIEHGSNSSALNDDIVESADGIELNERFTYRIEVQGHDQLVTISRPGKEDVEFPIDMSDSGYDEGDYMYFKAGSYSQNNTTDLDDDYDQVTFYALEQSHGNRASKSILDNLNDNVIVYPNPFIKTINIDFLENTIIPVAKVRVVDASGKAVLTADRNLQESSMQLQSNFSSGLYLIQLLDANSNVIAVKKVINK